MSIEHYPKHYGYRSERKDIARTERRADDRDIAGGIQPVARLRAKKDRRRWCKGRVGVEHSPAWQDYCPGGRPLPGWRVFACVVCGKQLRLDTQPESEE